MALSVLDLPLSLDLDFGDGRISEGCGARRREVLQGVTVQGVRVTAAVCEHGEVCGVYEGARAHALRGDEGCAAGGALEC